MHLFALLISAVLSSQFVAPNLIDAFTLVSPVDITRFELMTQLPEVVMTYSESASNAVGDLVWTVIADGVTEAPTIAAGKVSHDDSGNKYTIAAGVEAGAIHTEKADVPAIKINAKEEITDTPTYDNQFVTLPVVEPAAFTVGTEGKIKTAYADKLPAIPIACADFRGWVNNMKVTLSDGTNAAVGTVKVTPGENPGDPPTVEINAIADTTPLTFALTALPKTLTVKVFGSIGDGNPTDVEYPKSASLIVEAEPVFTADPPKILKAEATTTTAFVLTPLAAEAWDATVTVAVTKEKSAPSACAGEITANVSGKWNAVLNVAALELADTDTEFYIWAKKGSTIYPIPFAVEYEAEVPFTGNFTIDPSTSTFEAKNAVGPITFTNTGEVSDTPWGAKMKARFTHNNLFVDAEVNRDGAGSEGDPYVYLTGVVDLSVNLSIPTGGGVVAVTLSPDNTEKFIEGTDVKLTVAAEIPKPVFKFLPENITEEQAKGKVAISAEPNTPTEWDAMTAVKVVFTLNDTKPTTDVANQTWEIVKPDEPENAEGDPYLFEGEADLSKMTIPNTTVSIYVWIRLTDANNDTETLLTPVVIPFIPGSPPVDKPKFIITPNSVTEEELAKEVSPGFTITIAPNVSAPAKAAEAKLVWTVGEKSTDVKFAPGGNDTHPTWVVAEKQVNFTILEIATFPTVGKVAFYPTTAGSAEAFGPAVNFTFAKKAEPEPEAAMGVSPLLSLLAAAFLLLIKLL